MSECIFPTANEAAKSDTLMSRKRRYVGNPEQQAREVNEQPWEPLPGMVKRRCVDCDFWVAFPADTRGEAVCPDCQFLRLEGKRYGERAR